MEAEETVAVTGMVVSDVVERNASSATSSDTLRASAKRIKIFAIAATVLDTLQKTVSRLVHCTRFAALISRYLNLRYQNWESCSCDARIISERIAHWYFSTGAGVELLQL